MNIIDSFGWLEYFSGGSNAGYFLSPLEDPSSLIVPTITIYEVFKVVLRETGENEALQSIAAMQKGSVVDLTASIAMNASKISLQHHLPNSICIKDLFRIFIDGQFDGLRPRDDEGGGPYCGRFTVKIERHVRKT